MGKGRKAIPNKVLALRGGRAHTHRAPRNEPSPPAKIPTCPAHLDTKARNEWKRVAPLLDSIGIMTELDRATLAAYCEAYSRWVEATVKLKENGMVYYDKGIPRLNPYNRIAKEAYDQMIKTGTLLGMSPSSRASLSIAQGEKKQKDPYEEFLAKKAQN